jgi:xanthine dehydrogenase accessory factor
VLTPTSADLALVVAAHGNDEIATLRAGLEAGVRYVGLVASRKRGASVIEELRAEGVGEELLDALETPAGLDIGARTPTEVALSILARIIEVRRIGSEPDRTGTPVTAVDPICGMTVVIAADTPSLEHDGGTVYFCCAGCRRKFEERRDLARSDR